MSAPPDWLDDMWRLVERRRIAVERITKALSHLDRKRQIHVLCSYIPIDELEERIIPGIDPRQGP